MASKRPTPSSAERSLRKQIPAIIGRVKHGAKPLAAITASGYTYQQARNILAIADGGKPEITDNGYRNACKLLRKKLDQTGAEVDALLALRWQQIAVAGDDWRSIAELLKRRNPDEWAVTERSEVAIDADVTTRSDDAILDALNKLAAEQKTEDDAA